MNVVLDFQDSAADPDSAVAAYGKLMDNGMNIFTGGVLSGETASVVAAAIEDGIAIVTPTATADAAIQGNPNTFRVCFTDSSQGLASADYIADNKMADKVAVFYQSDIDYSVGLFENFKAQCAVRGVEIVEVQTFTTDSATDFSTQINAIADSGVNLVYIPIYAAEASTFLTQAQGKLDGKIFFGCDGLDGILGKVSDPAIAENVLMLTPFAADSTEDRTLINYYENALQFTRPDDIGTTKPFYDFSCVFMCQELTMLKAYSSYFFQTFNRTDPV
jgi:branched-chain amino acid transport system substrate-binding protein